MMPLVVLLLYFEGPITCILAALAFIFASLTDWADGYIARRSNMQYSKTPDNVVILSPQALLWPGKYDFAATPLAGVNWDEVTQKSTSGTCSNANGTFYFNVRFLGNVPLVFAVAENGNFPTGNGDVAQGISFFPKDRPKLSPPPHEIVLTVGILVSTLSNTEACIF